jgi:hypothetical protein
VTKRYRAAPTMIGRPRRRPRPARRGRRPRSPSRSRTARPCWAPGRAWCWSISTGTTSRRQVRLSFAQRVAR